jgi:hypothetical protein
MFSSFSHETLLPDEVDVKNYDEMMKKKLSHVIKQY